MRTGADTGFAPVAETFSASLAPPAVGRAVHESQALAFALRAVLALSVLFLGVAVIPWGSLGTTAVLRPVADRRFEIGSAGAAILAGFALAYVLNQA